MEPTASVLQELHTYLLRIRSVSEELENSPKRVKKQLNKVAAAEKALVDHHAHLKALKVNIHEREVSLKANTERIEKCKRDLDGVSSKKEFNALNIEVAALEKRNSDLEDEGLALMAQVEEATKKIPTLEAAIVSAKADHAKVDAEHQAQLPAWQARLDDARQHVAEKKKLIPLEWIKIFDRQEHTDGADAVAAVHGKSCSACYTAVTAQQYTQISTGRFEACKNCGKLLYVEVNETAGNA